MSYRVDNLKGHVPYCTCVSCSRNRLRKGSGLRMPSLKLIIFTLVCLSVVLAFAGVQPLSGYKDAVIGKVVSIIDDWKARDANFYKEYVELFKEYRIDNGQISPIVFDDSLNQLAAKRAIEISTDFSHDGIRTYNLGENIAMMVDSMGSPESLIRLWDKSLGHKQNMLRDYSRTGFAKDGKYAVQIFAY